MALLICSMLSLGVIGGRGVRGTAWKVRMASNHVIEAFCDLADKPSIINESINLLERFIVLLCDRTSNEYSISKAH